MQNTTTNTAIISELWSARFYEVLRVGLPFNDSIDMSWENELNLGDTLNISQIPDFDEATELTEGAAADTEAVTVTGIQLIINKLLTKDFQVTKRAQLQSLPFVDELREKATFSIMKKMQSIIIDTIVPHASNQLSYDSGTTLSLADILEAKETLDANNVPMENRIMTVGAAALNDLFNINTFVSKDFIPSGSPSTSGMFETQLSGFTPKFTTVVGTTTYFFHPRFMTMAVQANLDVQVHDLGVNGVRGARVNTDLLFGIKQLDNLRVVSMS